MRSPGTFKTGGGLQSPGSLIPTDLQSPRQGALGSAEEQSWRPRGGGLGTVGTDEGRRIPWNRDQLLGGGGGGLAPEFQLHRLLSASMVLSVKWC